MAKTPKKRTAAQKKADRRMTGAFLAGKDPFKKPAKKQVKRKKSSKRS